MTRAVHATVSGDRELDIAIVDLQAGFLAVLLAATTWLALGASYRALHWVPGNDLFYTWPVAATLITGTIFTYLLRTRSSRLAPWTLVLSLILANAFEMGFFPFGLAPYLFSLVAATAVLMMTERAAAIAAVLVLGTLGLVTYGMMPTISWREMRNPAALTALTGLVSWLGTRRFYTVLHWALTSTRQAMAATKEAQQQRAELVRLNKELDSSYMRQERLNRMLVLARRESEDARQLKVLLANSVSHELRGPLNLIIGYSEIMVNSPEVYGLEALPLRLRSHVGQIYQSSQHLSQLIDDVLDMGKSDVYRLALEKAPTALACVIAEAVDIVRGMCEQRGLFLRVEIEPDVPEVALDRTRIRQVLLNLLANALRFTSDGGVTVRLVCEGGEAVVGISDTGAGIASDDLPELFNEFGQVAGSPYRWYRGAGLGLAVSKRLVELHGGRIWAESTPGQGSTFSFALPLAPEVADLRGPLSPQEKHFWDHMERKACERKQIVVRAATPALQRLLGTHLPSYDITWAPPDADLVQIAADVHPFAVVEAMEGVDGDRSRLSQLVRTLPSVPFVICSLSGVAGPAPPGGLSNYLVKPVTRAGLACALERLAKELRTVLLVEDEAPMREFLKLTLSTLYPQCRILEAESGMQALALASRCEPDVLLLDLGLPDMDGLAVAARIRSANGTQLPIIAVTARDHPLDHAQDQPDVICCARAERFSQREIEKVLNAVLEVL